jgi:hypothetical protein
MSYTYDLPDFKRYLNDHNPSYRTDGLIFWQNRIPLPIDLFNRIFGESDYFFELYLDHLLVAVIAHAHLKTILGEYINFPELPGNAIRPRLREVSRKIAEILDSTKSYRKTASILAEQLGIDAYTPDSTRLGEALCHQGKKYSRLYCPAAFRAVLEKFHPDALLQIATDNTDMFGNIIADHYDIYRSGFSDALAIIFNLLLEFRLTCGGRSSSVHRIALTLEDGTDGISVDLKRTRDGSLWEPDYSDDHILRINPEHPFFCFANDAGATDCLYELLYTFSKFENSQFSDAQRKLLENMRQEISRELWIRHDK